MKRQRISGILTLIAMLVLILDSKTAATGAAEGISLCIYSVIPALFPFFILSNMLTSSLLGQQIPLISAVGKMIGFPPGTESLLIPAFLGGYPSGAQAVAQSYRQGFLSKDTAGRLIAFCNNPGPSFIFGLLSSCFSSIWIPWVLWIVQITSAIVVACLLPYSQETNIPFKIQSITLTDALAKSLKSMSSVCGWVILFRTLVLFFQKWFLWCFPSEINVLIVGLLELTNGCMMLTDISDPRLRMIVCTAMLSMGGACVSMQTISVTEHIPLGLYFPGKLIHCTISVSILVVFLYNLWWAIPVLIIFLLLPIKKSRKWYSISTLHHV